MDEKLSDKDNLINNEINNNNLINNFENNNIIENDNIIQTNIFQNDNGNLFHLEYLNSKNKQIVPIIIIFQKNELNIYKNDLIILFKNYNDIISIKFEEDILNDDIINLKKNNKIKEEILENKIFFQLNLISLNKKVNNSCLNCFCCCCKSNNIVKERKFLTFNFLINKNLKYQLYEKFSYYLPTSFLKEIISNNRKMKLLIFVNPASGTGQAINTYNKALPLLNKGNVTTRVVFTEYKNHAYDYVQNLKINEYDGIIVCSGDGIMHEIINSIFNRNDKDIFINNIILGVIPGGSANALCKVISNYNDDNNDLENFIYYILKGNSKYIDIQEYELLTEQNVSKKIYSFLSLTWGIIADIDLESECLRCLGGEARFTIMGAIRWLWLREIYGNLMILKEDSNVNINDIPSIKENLSDEFISNNMEVFNDKFNLFLANNTKFISENNYTNPLSELDDGKNDILFLKNSDSGKFLLFKELVYYLDDGDMLFSDKDKKEFINGIHYKKCKFFRLIPKINLTQNNDVNVSVLNNFTFSYSIDGEKYPICPIQCKTLNRVIRIFSAKE